MLNRLETLTIWLQELFGTSACALVPASEDASFRKYYRLTVDNKNYLVMDAPPEHEDCALFVAVTSRLKKSGINVPELYEKNNEKGFLLLTDFGNELYLDKLTADTADDLYRDAIKTLVRLQTFSDSSGLNDYSEPLLRQEIYLFKEWLLGRHLKITLDAGQARAFEQLCDLLVANALEQPQVFVHRDFHSRNLMVTQENNPGVIDYQDAVLGPVSYDVVSLLKDCYIKWPEVRISQWIEDYLNEMALNNPAMNIDQKLFNRWFDLMGVQRHLKAGGIFARLSQRDHKHGFLKDLPRTLSYITDLEPVYPELETLIQIIKVSVLPNLEPTGSV